MQTRKQQKQKKQKQKKSKKKTGFVTEIACQKNYLFLTTSH